MSTDCGYFRNQIPRAMLGDISSDELQGLNAHLLVCPVCKEEERLYANTLDQLHSVSDSPAPKHFFIYGRPPRQSPWTLFRSMSLAWQGAAASIFVAVALLGALTAARLQVRFEGGAMILSFGGSPVARPSPPPAPGIDMQALEARILQVAEERNRNEVLDWVRTLRDEIARGNRQLDARQRAVLQTALANVENRMAGTLSETAQAVEAKTDKSLGDLYATVSQQRERDGASFNDRINRVALNSETRSNQTDAILETLLQAAELRLKQ